MDIIEQARELGRAIQKEESFINLHKVQAKADADTELQKYIGEFNLKRMQINDEASKKDRDQEKLTALNKEMRAFDKVLNRVMAIVQQSAEGIDPEIADYNESCSGSCSTCGGCG